MMIKMRLEKIPIPFVVILCLTILISISTVLLIHSVIISSVNIVIFAGMVVSLGTAMSRIKFYPEKK